MVHYRLRKWINVILLLGRSPYKNNKFKFIITLPGTRGLAIHRSSIASIAPHEKPLTNSPKKQHPRPAWAGQAKSMTLYKLGLYCCWMVGGYCFWTTECHRPFPAAVVILFFIDSFIVVLMFLVALTCCWLFWKFIFINIVHRHYLLRQPLPLL